MILKPREMPIGDENIFGVIKKSVNPKIWPFIDDKYDRNEVHTSAISSNKLVNEKSKRIKAFLPVSKIVRRINPHNDENPETLYYAIQPILITAQFFGILPLLGIWQSPSRNLSYRLLSVKTFYTLLIIIMLAFTTVVATINMINSLNPNILKVKNGVASATAGVVFYGNSLFGLIIFWWLAPRWINLQKKWQLMEQQLDSNRPTPQLRWKFRMITIMVMIPALLEHIISIVNNMPINELSGNGVNATWRDYLQLYSIKSHGFVVNIYKYNVALGIFLFIISKIATFVWNFTDLFIILISIALSERYRVLNKILLNSTSFYSMNIDWSEFRKNYACLSGLVKQVDSDISPIILLSFVNNLYFICLQLLNGLSPGDHNIINYIYFFGSFGFLLGRTVGVTLLAARINDQSKMALPALYSCSPVNFNIETQRLQLQLTTDDVSLTGLRFFSITRNFMLAVGGAIVTYEVVLLQFNQAMTN